MGKIKGWTRTFHDKSKNSEMIVWNHDKEKDSSVKFVQDFSWYSVTTTEKFGGGFVSGNGEVFRNKQQALDYAIKYMKSHPQG
jgi:hypothetical protein